MTIKAFFFEGNGCFSRDVGTLSTAIKAANVEIILFPGNSRVKRSIAAAALRAGATIDTNITDLRLDGDNLVATRWVYRQRILVEFTRNAKPWVIVCDPTLFDDMCSSLGVSVETLADNVETEPSDTVIKGVESALSGGESTIRPEAELLFVAGAGWTKKQADGTIHLDEAATVITSFLAKSGASLGSSKSLVDMPEIAEKFSFMSHMNQVGQTGSVPRHRKGLSTCCHGEEPHVVGWRFINERRAINLDANCGWAQGKADVLYVADAFEVMKKVNELLG